jgi:hypothetical protein
MADYFEEVIDRMEKKYNCTVIYFTMDSDGGTKKGRLILQERRPWLLVPQCFGHHLSFHKPQFHSFAKLLSSFN